MRTGSEDEDLAGAEPLRLVRPGELRADTAQTAGMRRSEAISGAACGSRALWMGETRMAPGAISANHHHGHSETGIYVSAGRPVFVMSDGAGGERRLETQPGDYVFVPPYVAHREENPSFEEEAVVVIARSTQQAIVVNLGDSSLGAPSTPASPA
ncbi:MAG TPA: cupin domain-containing protein [Acidimicrobiales bacterium]|nr:cupin domain-containing protein [Acidimicrobiales bacterium]